MKILIVNTYDLHGGAARAANRLHKALLSKNIDSKMLVLTKSSNDISVFGPVGKVEKLFSKLSQNIDFLPLKFYNKDEAFFSTACNPINNIVDKINALNPDIVHLHWICGGMMRIEDILKIKAPIIWSLHDNWAFTGGCHVMWECERYKEKCGKCPRLNSKKDNDLSRKIWLRKKETFTKCKSLTIIGLSKWITNCSKESNLLKSKKIINLPNPINKNIYKPFDKAESRELWNFPKNKKLILFGAVSATSDINKGFIQLYKALKNLKNEDIELIVFGSNEPKDPPNLGFKINYMGSLTDDISLVTLYNAVDVMIVPSLQENLSNAIMESLSCGTPVVAFNIGGNSDMVEHKINGYLAKPYDTNDLAKGIEWILNNKNYDTLSINAREKVIKEFSQDVVVEKYINLYKEIING